ncbi:MAG TPA: extradiol dioxygenase [Candidatus Sulfotelmatobacter sp.]|nr:extradiol dioxygenase [Candidatus Sulfotelmatobacter sp.]
MIFGAHILVYSNNPELDRAFFRDVLGFSSVDAGGGWLTFALPPAEAAFHPLEVDSLTKQPADRLSRADLYLMCDDVKETVALLREKKVRCPEIHEERWGLRTAIPLPSGGKIGLYQPTHPMALKRARGKAKRG